MKLFLKNTLLTVLAVIGFVNVQAQESTKNPGIMEQEKE